MGGIVSVCCRKAGGCFSLQKTCLALWHYTNIFGNYYQKNIIYFQMRCNSKEYTLVFNKKKQNNTLYFIEYNPLLLYNMSNFKNEL